ncbi:MAG: nucleotide exchange factor GrpE [Flavobacteriales bacterium]|nr:nucleotide exchange factor GrpE [Flavobacteriales bacterium]
MPEKKLKKEQEEAQEINETPEASEDQVTEKEPVVELSREEQLENEVAELKNKQLRMFAEFENFKKRTAKERIDLFRNAGLEFFESMLPVLDDFDRAAKHRDDDQDPEALTKGIDLIHSKLIAILEQKGLKVMESSVGSDFDTDFHEAITQIPAPSEELKGKVIDETEKGYLLNDKVIRYAKVVVGQ